MPQEESIVIRGFGSISPLGSDAKTIAKAYQQGTPAFQVQQYNGHPTPVGNLKPETAEKLNQLQAEKRTYQALDKTVLMAMYAARQAVTAAGWTHEKNIAVNIGSSRGATGLFEGFVEEFLSTGTLPAHTSPVTTLGNISSWVANDLQASGPVISHSVTCSTALQAIANGFAWLKSGMATKFLAGGSEAPLTPFTVAQMKAVGIYSSGSDAIFPCRPFNLEKKNTFTLGEGAAVFALELVTKEKLDQEIESSLILESIGFGFETIPSKSGISKEGTNFKLAMEDALHKLPENENIDLIIMHAPGTVAGDAAELNAVAAVFGADQLPTITSNKFLIGHTLGASAALSLEYAIAILECQTYLPLPYPTIIQQKNIKPIKRIMLNAAGFGGNAVSLIISRKSF
ncbi:beta-ketoacyl synthase N-terminal-like domain-containing protein [Adhaeribacter aquaticus]|uniref:beta-ketoacyl synthase N-terminal-like domain-containing protein n=1 Tax=Adhaeribacter aquaticus TaxID=299567 RepID=UPI0004176E52|nr:beta-ketoacyl synthase N-terminal-like domain-containing protein [Adhaeribacter aquaticus]